MNRMKSSAKILCLCAVSLGLVACETTGDPNRGGIFWSESKANDRLQERRSNLGAIQADTERVNRTNAGMENAAARKRQMLGQ